MKSVSMTRSQGQVYSVGNYLMTGKVLGKGHFARVEEATHRVIGKKVAIKIIDLTCIKEEYARRNLHREPRVMARLRHPCIAALYETMMHGPRLYVVMEAACGGDLCAHVLGSRGARGLRGLPEARARSLAAQLVSAVRHMHARGVVHRDLKMENIMLDSSKQFIKIVDFGLSNVWCCGSGLRTPCGSLEYAAPELFRDGHRYGPEVDLWSIGVIVFGMVTGGLPFTGGGGGGGGGGGEGARSRPQLRAAIARGFTRKQRNALQATSTECKTFVQHLLEPNVDLRMKIEEAARHRWLRRPGLRMKTHPFADVDHKLNRDIYRQISEVIGKVPSDVAAQVKADPFGSVAGIYNIKVHHHQMQAIPGTDLLWSSIAQEPSPQTPPEYKNKIEKSEAIPIPVLNNQTKTASEIYHTNFQNTYSDKLQIYGNLTKTSSYSRTVKATPINGVNGSQQKTLLNPISPTKPTPYSTERRDVKTTSLITKTVTNGVVSKTVVNSIKVRLNGSPTTRLSILSRPLSGSAVKKQDVRSPHDNGDCPPRLPCIEEHSITNMTANPEVNRLGRINRGMAKVPFLKQLTERQSVDSTKTSEGKRIEFYRKGGDGLPSWKASGSIPVTPARILLQTNATSIKRASLGNIVSPHSSTNSHCKSDRTPIGWYASSLGKSPAPLQRFRKTAL